MTWWRRWWGPLIGLLLAGAAVMALERLLRQVTWAQILAAVIDMPWPQVVVALVLPVGSIALLTGLDRRHARHLGYHVPGMTACVAVTCAQGISLSIGNSLVMGGIVRVRVYGAAGLAVASAAFLAALQFVAVNVGVAAAAGVAWWVAPGHPSLAGQALAALGVGLGLGWLLLAWLQDPRAGWIAFVVQRLTQRLVQRVGRLPTPRVAAIGLLTGMVEKTMVTGGVLLLLPAPAALGTTPGHVVAAFLAAVVVGKWSQVPGGLGVIEAAFLSLLPQAPTGDVLAATLAAFIVFRLAYYVLPLLLAGTIVAVGEASAWRWLPRIPT